MAEIRADRYVASIRRDRQRVAEYVMQLDCDRLNRGLPMLTPAEARGARCEAILNLARHDVGREIIGKAHAGAPPRNG